MGAQPDIPPTHGPGHEGADPVLHLEPDQLVASTFKPLPRAQVGPRMRLALWALRIITVLVAAMVLYAFFAELS